MVLNNRTENMGEVIGNRVTVDSYPPPPIFNHQDRPPIVNGSIGIVRVLVSTCPIYCGALDCTSERYLLFSDLHFQNMK